MLKSLTKLFFVLFIISFLMLFLGAKVTSSAPSNLLFAFLGYFCLTLVTIKFYENKLPVLFIVITLFASMFLMQSYTIYLCFIENLFSLPFIFIYCLGIICGFFCLKLKQPINILAVSLSFLLTIFMFFQGWDFWIHKINFGTFTGNVAAYNLPAKFESFDEQKNITTENDFDGKVVLLDFWTTTCGICFKKFPQLQVIHEKYKNDSSVKILAVNTPLEEDKPNQAFNDIRKREYTFPVVITADENLAEKYDVKGYPTTFVINPDGQIIFKGDIEGAVKVVDELKSNR